MAASSTNQTAGDHPLTKAISFALAGMLWASTPAVLAAGDAQRGQELYESRCTACHSVDQNRVGPAHQAIFGRRAGSVANYDYSASLKRSKLVWTEKTLDRWLANPERLIPGQRMGYSVTEAKDRADLIAYLRQVSPR